MDRHPEFQLLSRLSFPATGPPNPEGFQTGSLKGLSRVFEGFLKGSSADPCENPSKTLQRPFQRPLQRPLLKPFGNLSGVRESCCAGNESLEATTSTHKKITELIPKLFRFGTSSTQITESVSPNNSVRDSVILCSHFLSRPCNSRNNSVR